MKGYLERGGYDRLLNSMEQNHSWEANSHSASQEISCLSWNLKVHYRVHKILALAPILSQMNSIHTLISYLFNIF
jgi:hypothetical protein